MKKNKRYTEEFKREVLEMAASKEISIAQLARDLGIAQSLIYKWRERYRVDEESGELKPSEEREAEAEIRRLKRELSVVKQERDILKKRSRCSHGIGSYEIRIYGGSSRSIRYPGHVSCAGRISKRLLCVGGSPGQSASAGR